MIIPTDLEKHRIWAKAMDDNEKPGAAAGSEVSPNGFGVAANILGGVAVGSNNWFRVTASLTSLSPNWADAIHASLEGKGRVIKDSFLIETDQFGDINEGDVRCTGFVSCSTERKTFKPEERQEFSKFLEDRKIREYGEGRASAVMFDKEDKPILAGLYTDGENPWTIKQDEEGNLVVTKTINKELDKAIQTASIRAGSSSVEGIMTPKMSNQDVGVIAFLDYNEKPAVGVAYKPVANTTARVSVMREESFDAGAGDFKPVDISVHQVLAFDSGDDPATSPFYQPVEQFVNKVNAGELKPTDEFASQLQARLDNNEEHMIVTAAMSDTLINNGKVDPAKYYAYIYRKYKESPELRNMINYAKTILKNNSMIAATTSQLAAAA